MLNEKIHRYIYILGLILLGVSIPFSEYLMSVSQFILATNWLLEGRFIRKWERIKSNYAALCLISLFMIHVFWMIGYQDVVYGLKDLRIKLPMLILPLMIGSSQALSKREFKLILHLFLISIVVSTSISAVIYLGQTSHTTNSYREVSVFISHIRLSLLTVMGIFISYYYAFKSSLKYRFIYFLPMVWLSVFLYFLGANSGMLILGLVIFLTLVRSLFLSKNTLSKYISVAFIGLILMFSLWKTFGIYRQFFQFDKVPQIEELERYTQNNHSYEHIPSAKTRENGHLVYLYICQTELEQEWNRRSNIDFYTGLNANGDPIKFTIYHYLTSLDYRKDSVGIGYLSEQDIRLIEKGYSNHIFKHQFSLYAKVYPIIKQLYYYFETGYASGGTMAQRLEYLKVAKAIIQDHFWLGTGTANVQMAFDEKYALGISSLPEVFRLRAHNQFVTFFISFGFLGFLLAVWCMFTPFFKPQYQHFLSFIFFIVAYSSMLSEDTLETQAGITFYTFFFVILLVAKGNEKNKI